MGARTIRILIADSPSAGGLRLRTLIRGRNELQVVAQETQPEAVVRAARRQRADLALIDLRLGFPGEFGCDLVRRLTEGHVPGTRVILRARRGLEDGVNAALASGVSGFVLEEASADELIFAIHAVVDGGMFVSPSVLARVVRSAAEMRVEDGWAAQDNLTVREIEVIRLVAQGLSNREIAGSLRVAETTVRTHVGHLLTKLDLRNRVEIAAFAYRGQMAPRMRTTGVPLAVQY